YTRAVWNTAGGSHRQAQDMLSNRLVSASPRKPVCALAWTGAAPVPAPGLRSRQYAPPVTLSPFGSQTIENKRNTQGDTTLRVYSFATLSRGRSRFPRRPATFSA